MDQLKAVIIGTSPAETMLLEETFQQTGYLESFRYIGLDQLMERVPDWKEWDLLLARYNESACEILLSLLAPVLRKGSPPVIFLVDPFDPVLVNQLMNKGARRVLPVCELSQVLEPCLATLFGSEPLVANVSPGESSPRDTKNGVSPSPVSGEGLARLFSHSPIGVSIFRLRDGKCVDCNESYARLLEWPREMLIGSEPIELSIPPDVRKFFEPGGQGQNETTPHPGLQYERKIYTGSRQIRHIQVNLDLVEWGGEECLLSLVQDITEKELAKEKIKRLNEELERLVQVRTGALHAANRELAAEIGRRKSVEIFSKQLTQVVWETPDVVAICAPDGRMQFLNKAGRILFGLGEEDPVSQLDLFSAYPEDMREWVRTQVLPVVIRDGIWRGETSFKLPGRRVIPLSQVLACKKDVGGNVLYFATIARDISDFKRVEQELRQSRERYRTLAEAAHDFIFMVSKDGRMEYANEYACQALGFDPNQVEGVPAELFFPKDFAANHLQMFSEVHAIDRPIYTEGPFLRDGAEFWLGTWLVPIHDEQGGLASVLGISRDITEQKKTDEALQRALQNERKLGEMRSNFFSMTSHQFRTPLSTILLSTELLAKYGQRWDEQKRAEHLGRIQEAARRLNSMLEDILVIGRVESGRYVCSPKEFDLVSYINQCFQEISVNDRGDHHLVFNHSPEKIPVYHDPDILHRVIDNLLSNAIKYTPSGKRVTVTLRQEETFVLLEVADEGIGIPESDMKYLFQPFQRGSNANDYPGTGIGLTIIQKSVELLNGSVSVKSKEGQGTTFMVRFPSHLESESRRVIL